MKSNPKLKTFFISTGTQVAEVIQIKPNVFVLSEYVFQNNTSPLFDEKIDAMYYNFKKAVVDKGKPINNYKASPYYNDYITRLKVECPEYFI